MYFALSISSISSNSNNTKKTTSNYICMMPLLNSSIQTREKRERERETERNELNVGISSKFVVVVVVVGLISCMLSPSLLLFVLFDVIIITTKLVLLVAPSPLLVCSFKLCTSLTHSLTHSHSHSHTHLHCYIV